MRILHWQKIGAAWELRSTDATEAHVWAQVTRHENGKPNAPRWRVDIASPSGKTSWALFKTVPAARSYAVRWLGQHTWDLEGVEIL